MKWYEYRDIKTGELTWWTQRDRNGNCFEIRRLLISKKFRLFVNEIAKQDFCSLDDAQAAAKALWNTNN